MSAVDSEAMREWINASFAEERLPYELEWTKSAGILNAADFEGVIAGLRAATPA